MNRQSTQRAPAAATFIFGVLRGLKVGTLSLDLPDGSTRQFGTESTLAASLKIHDWRVFSRLLKGGDIAFAECFIEGLWSTPNLAAVIELAARNRAVLARAIYGSWWGQLAYRVKHLIKRNTATQARRNIAAHYDLGNDFYALWLDPSMTYSSALFNGDLSLSLEAAQANKYRRIIAQLQIAPGAQFLEIGCGWGGFAELAAREAHAHTRGITLSTEQLAYAQARLDQAGIAHQANLTLTDYRDMGIKPDERFDHIVSIEMFEAVGEAYWDDYFACVKRCLKPGGTAVVQTITIADELFVQYRTGTDFIQQFIFPGGMLPSPSEFRRRATRAGLEVIHEHAFGLDYAATLARWHVAFLAHEAQVRALKPANGKPAFDDAFIRTWVFYLAYCEGAFRAGSIDVMQFGLRA